MDAERVTVDRTVSDVLSMAGHELAQPLAVAIACAQLMVQPHSGLSDERRKIEETLLRTLDQLKSLIGDLELTGSADLLGEVNQEKLAGRRELYMMSGVLEAAVEDFHFSHPRSRIDLESDEDLPVKLDLSRFRQVLSNLLSNAEKFSPPDTTIRLRGRRVSSDVVLHLHNEGQGFSAIDAARIFEKKVRLDDIVSGNGWGLYVAKAIVEAHGGELWAEESIGHGASFFIRIPTAENS